MTASKSPISADSACQIAFARRTARRRFTFHKHARLPAEILADRLQDLGHRLLQRRRLGHHAADVVLHQNPPLLLPPRRDIDERDHRAAEHARLR